MQIDFSRQRVWGPTPLYEKVLRYSPPKKQFYVLSGPCSVEDELQIHRIAKLVASNGATHLRGGVYRAGTYPSSRYGLVDKSLLKSFKDAAHSNGLKTVIEVVDILTFNDVYDYADCFQVGCRQMQNYGLLRLLGTTFKTVFLKRHPGSTLDEFLGAAEHLLVNNGCMPVLIERGSSSHMNHTRWDLSISTIAAIKNMTLMPVLCDPSHGTGRRDLVEPMAYAGVAAGADGLLIEVHTEPDKSLSDKEQAIDPDRFAIIMKNVMKIRSAINGI